MAEQRYFEDIQPGDELPPLRKTPSTADLVMFSGAVGDFSPIGFDLRYAREAGLEGVVVQGGLKTAYLGQLLHDWVAPGGVIRCLASQYRGMDYPNQPLLCRGIVTRTYEEDGAALVDLDVWTENAAGFHTSPGTATVALPRRPHG